MSRTGTVAGVQARMGSSRLPGKSLADLAGRTMLERIVERVRAARRVDAVVVLTSEEASDDPLAASCAERGIPVRRGPLRDVLARYLALLDELEPSFVVRVTADCPFVSPAHVDLQLEALAVFDADFTALPPGAPTTTLEGQGAMSARALRAAAVSTDPRDREHVGSFWLSANAARFRTVELEVPPALLRDDVRLTVDEPADLELARAVYAALAPEHGSLAPLERVLAWLDAHPEVKALNAGLGCGADTGAAHAAGRAAARVVVGRHGPRPRPGRPA